MRAKIDIIIEDDTSAEELRKHGMPEEDLRTLYDRAFRNIIDQAVDPRARYTLHVTISDNTKEGRKQ